MTQPGPTYLVGAGPGDPGLITQRGLECLRAADVVVYDRLVNPALLQEARADAELIYVGKAPQHSGLSQQAINELLVERAAAGKTVVRLKGGDPFVFGRGGEEAAVLVAHGLPFEVVPGVTSAIAVPAYAGIPVTHRDYAASFTVLTGHEEPGKGETFIDWRQFAEGPATLVLLMGVGHLAEITAKLIAAGRPPDTPAAVIRWGTVAEQQTVIGQLQTIAAQAVRGGLTSPAVTIIGDVVRLRDQLRWFDNRPLFGRRILVTRAREQAGELSRQLRALGAEPIELPVIQFLPMPPGSRLDDALLRLDGFGWIIFTSANGVRFCWERLRAAGRDARAFGRARIGAIGPGTAAALEHVGIAADFVPSRFVAESVAEELPDVDLGPILLPRADIAREALAALLRARGADVHDVPAYRTVPAPITEADLRAIARGRIDAVTFTSSSTARCFVEATSRLNGLLRDAVVASIGPITSATARDLGLSVTVEAREHTIPGLVRALLDHYFMSVRAAGPV